jgi:hypothetical protein
VSDSGSAPLYLSGANGQYGCVASRGLCLVRSAQSRSMSEVPARLNGGALLWSRGVVWAVRAGQAEMGDSVDLMYCKRLTSPVTPEPTEINDWWTRQRWVSLFCFPFLSSPWVSLFCSALGVPFLSLFWTRQRWVSLFCFSALSCFSVISVHCAQKNRTPRLLPES